MNGRNIRFRVDSATSEAEDGMVARLQSGEAGWESGRSCSYPQQLTLQLLLPILTKSLTLVFHQYKIPSHIELFIKAVRSEKWRKLGFVRPSDNSQSLYQEKEQRTIFLEFPCSYVRLVMQRPYQNEYNLFQQVALERVMITGEILPPKVLAQYNVEQAESEEEDSEEETGSTTQKTESQKYLQSECHTDRVEKKSSPQTKGIIREEFQKVFQELDSRKQQAVQREDYEQAAILKQRLKIFKDLQRRLEELETAKKHATEHQEYERCSQLKAQIVLLRQTIEVEVNNFFSGKQNNPHSSSMLSQYESTPQQINVTQLTAIPVRYSDYRSSAIVNTENKPSQKVSHDDQVLPALINKAMTDNRERLDHQPPEAPEEPSIEQEPQLSKRDSIDDKMLKRLEVHFGSIPEEIWRDMCIKNWKVRENAFKRLEQMQISTKEQMMAAYELCTLTITDKHSSIIIHTLLLLTRVIRSEANASLRVPPPVPQFLNDQLLQAIVALFGESNQKIRELSINTFFEMPELAIVPTTQVINHLIRASKSATGKPSPKVQQSKLVLARRMIERYSLTNNDLEGLLNWAVSCLEDSSQEVRSSATELIITGLIPRLGENVILKKVEHIRSNVLESFMVALNSSLQFDQEEHSEFNHVHRAGRDNTLVEYEEYYAGSKDQYPDIQSAKKPQKVSAEPPPTSKQPKETRVLELTSEEEDHLEEEEYVQDPSLCDYCSEPLNVSPTSSKTAMDQAMLKHLEEQCRAIVTCEECQQCIYIRELTGHLLKDCQESRYQQCRRCRLAFPPNDIYVHEAQNVCKPLPRDMERCQLCSANIEPTRRAWISHCFNCSSNDRNS